MKNRNSETCWKSSILFPRVVSASLNGEITSSTIVQKLKIMTGMDLRNKMKNRNCQTCWTPSILLHTVVRPCSTDYEIGSVELELLDG